MILTVSSNGIRITVTSGSDMALITNITVSDTALLAMYKTE